MLFAGFVSRLTGSPKNTAIIVNGTSGPLAVSLTCLSQEDIKLFYKPLGSNISTQIYPHQPDVVNKRSSVSRETLPDGYSFTIRDISEDDVGTYTCAVFDIGYAIDPKEEMSAELIIVDGQDHKIL